MDNNKKTTKIDKRIVKTQNKLIMGFANLLKEKSIDEIKVSELTGTSDVNRATFYLHYKDIDDFVNQIEADLIEGFSHIFTSADMHINSNGSIPTVSNIFDFVSEHSLIMSALLSKNGDNSFAHKLAYVARYRVEQEFLSKNSKDACDFYSVYYIINGMTGVIFKWIDGGFKESVEDMTSILVEFITIGTKIITPE